MCLLSHFFRHIPFHVRKTLTQTLKVPSLAETAAKGIFAKSMQISPAKKGENEDLPEEAEPEVDEGSPNKKLTLEVKTSDALKEFLESSHKPLPIDLRPRQLVKLNIPFNKQKQRYVLLFTPFRKPFVDPKGSPHAQRFVPFNTQPAIFSKVSHVSPMKFEHYTKRGVLFADQDKNKTCHRLDYDPKPEATVRSLSLGSKAANNNQSYHTFALQFLTLTVTRGVKNRRRSFPRTGLRCTTLLNLSIS